MFPPFDTSFFASHVFWLLIFFSLFYFLMSRIILPRISNIIEIRRDRIAYYIDQAASIERNAEIVESQYNKLLICAKKEAENIIKKAYSDAQNILDNENKKNKAFLEKKLFEISCKFDDIYKNIIINKEDIAEDLIIEILKKFTGNEYNRSFIKTMIKNHKI